METVQIIKCGGCGRTGVAINGRRVTDHKCAGAWTFLREEQVPTAQVQAALVTRRAA